MGMLDFKYGDFVLCITEKYGRFLGTVTEVNRFNVTVKPADYLKSLTGVKELEVDQSRVQLVGEEGKKVLRLATANAYQVYEYMEEKGMHEVKEDAYFMTTRAYVETHYRSA